MINLRITPLKPHIQEDIPDIVPHIIQSPANSVAVFYHIFIFIFYFNFHNGGCYLTIDPNQFGYTVHIGVGNDTIVVINVFSYHHGQ